MLSVGVIAAVLASAAFILMTVKDRTYVASAPYAPSGAANHEVAVIYYSRSGHSEAVAREIARTFNAPIAHIDADYPRDYAGQAKAVADAEARTLPKIHAEPIDLSPARRVYLVSPTWLFRPAPPLWSYVEQADLTGKEVVLVMTGNSRFKQEQIDAFAERVHARGGRLIRHVFLRRGRVFWQMSREQLLREAREQVVATQ
ncbi:hypothetical protein P2318_32515 [Myxococcaceae bacterium GXIMD 01537]